MDSQTPRESEYRSPLAGRYASAAMRELFSAQRKHATWRRLWLALAESQKQLGLDIPAEALEQMRAHLDDIDFQAAGEYERRFRHDVMAHIHAFGDVAPAAAGILHLGATSQFVNCNTDMLQMREGLMIVRDYLAGIVDALGSFAAEYRDLPCLGFTHLQPAQMVTVGKRASLWCYDFVRDLEQIEFILSRLEFRGVKGTTGTQASFLALFDGDHQKVLELERMVAEKMGFDRIAPVTGQTYSRKVDARIVEALAQVAASVHKFCNDIRLLAHMKEIEEPFASGQVGSSAMAYKRNPMRCERATGLARFLMDVARSPLHTAAEQWFERTLDDSANKRLAISESFLAADAICRIVLNVSSGLVVYPAVIEAHVRQELPFMATENILMAAVKAGGDRQELHEIIRRHSIEAARKVKHEGGENDLISRLEREPAFADLDFQSLLNPSTFTGRCGAQVDAFLAEEVEPIRQRYAHALGAQADLEI
jgi:adenylosuccinate lyase